MNTFSCVSNFLEIMGTINSKGDKQDQRVTKLQAFVKQEFSNMYGAFQRMVKQSPATRVPSATKYSFEDLLKDEKFAEFISNRDVKFEATMNELKLRLEAGDSVCRFFHSSTWSFSTQEGFPYAVSWPTKP